MEENDAIFLTAGDALVYLAKPLFKKYSITFVWGYPFSTYVSYDQFFNHPSLCAPLHILHDPASIPPVAYVNNGWPILNQKTIKNIQTSYSLKYKHSKKKCFAKK